MFEDADNYQRGANQTAIYPGKGSNQGLVYVALGLAGEAGEFANKVKKILRDHESALTEEMHTALCRELGDITWYAAQACTELHVSLSFIMQDNLNRLADRAKRGKIKGEGDDR